ncbi:DUF4349 domain-containing protein [Mucilaginibacter sp. BT774]|uniref:DUF4349 domain-containing protein n=1 Tax=Mucilaginibacter sp. BT774 TaxID=3062276 RepID=UPI0026749A8D|nr:DUF4349 domain-containing protein [Mucilaginibacter sp. BT774]MDO3627085.1 DUF4349 domain-containing protein [Mucilaginibacter sp. BT774]
MKRVLTIVLITFIFTGCKQASNPEKELKIATLDRAKASSVSENTDKIADTIGVASSSQQPISDTSKKIIKTGDISFETGDLYGTRKKIITSLKNLSGYVSEENETNDSYRRSLTLKLRVPAKNFDLLLDSVSGNASKIDSKNVRVADVTSQFIDIKTSLVNQQLLEKRYQDLLKRSDKISDVLQIENKLTEIRTAIDSTQGTLNYLSRQVAYSILEVNLYSEQTPQYSGTTIGDRLSASLKGGWELMQNLFFGIINIWPLAIVAVVVYLIIKRWRAKRKLRVVQQ